MNRTDPESGSRMDPHLVVRIFPEKKKHKKKKIEI